jgi:hypothetical protein
MTKKNLFLILVAIGLATVYAIWFTNWFRPKTLGIFTTSRNLAMTRWRGSSLQFNVMHPAQFTELKVVVLDAYRTNKNTLPVWHLVSDSNSVPVRNFSYGQYIPGMRPDIAGTHAESLETNVVYRLLVTSGKIKDHHDFQLK